MNILALSTGLGLMVSLLFAEVFFIAPGGMVVPGYLALQMNQPLSVLATLLVAFITFVTVRVLSGLLIVYGRRRTALMILFGYLAGFLVDRQFGSVSLTFGRLDVIGHIIPGIIAIWFDRQGVVKTVAGLIIVSSITRLFLILATGGGLQQ